MAREVGAAGAVELRGELAGLLRRGVGLLLARVGLGLDLVRPAHGLVVGVLRDLRASVPRFSASACVSATCTLSCAMRSVIWATLSAAAEVFDFAVCRSSQVGYSSAAAGDAMAARHGQRDDDGDGRQLDRRRAGAADAGSRPVVAGDARTSARGVP